MFDKINTLRCKIGENYQRIEIENLKKLTKKKINKILIYKLRLENRTLNNLIKHSEGKN